MKRLSGVEYGQHGRSEAHTSAVAVGLSALQITSLARLVNGGLPKNGKPICGPDALTNRLLMRA